MGSDRSAAPILFARFGPFELDVRGAQLRKHGTRIRLHEQPFRILLMLVSQPGEVVLREDIRETLWPNGTVVEYDRGINTAIQRLRDALSDSAEKPRYIETQARRGYRFIAEVQVEAQPAGGDPKVEVEPQPEASPVEAAPAGDWIGRTVAHYRVIGRLGSGGMGVVYRAEDLRLGRQVALKFPPDETALDPLIRARFQREARAASALNHPNVCTIYGVEESGGHTILAMELLEGETLEARLERGRLTRAQVLRLAIEISSALAAAHRKGIVHRDLKPANVMLTKTGAKVLDFGLAKMAAVDGRSNQPAISEVGVILGTMRYMSPEQVQGKEADARSDIFAFGLLLYEMLTGRPAFDGPSRADAIAAILRSEPVWDGLEPDIERVTRKCLAKDPDARWQSAADLRDELEWIAERPAASGALPPAKTMRRLSLFWLPLAAAAGCLAAALYPLPQAAAPRLTLFAAESEVETMPAWSPKGDRLAYVAEVNGTLQVFTKAPGLAALTQMTHQPASCYSPAWSQDGARIYFLSSGGLYSIAVAGGPPQSVLTGFAFAAISPDGKSLAALVRGTDGNVRVEFSSPIGTPPKPYTNPLIAGLTSTEASSSLAFTRDGRYLGLIGSRQGQGQFWMIPVAGGPPVQRAYAGREFTFFTWLGDGARIVTASTGSSESHLGIANLRTGASYPITAGSTRDGYPALSPDGHTLAYSAGDAGYRIMEVPLNGEPAHEVTASSRNEVSPSLAPDGKHFAYITSRNGVQEVWYRDRTDGSERRIAGQKDFGAGESRFLDCAVSPDGNRIAYRRDGGIHEIWISPVSGETPVRLWDDPARVFQRGPAWSPDGNWIAYHSLWQGKYAYLKIRVGAGTAPELVAYGELSSSPPAWSPRGDRIGFRDGSRMRVVSADGKDIRTAESGRWETYGWSKDGSALYGIAVDENRHLALKRLDVATGMVSKIADDGPIPPGFDLANHQSVFWYRGFSLNPDGKSFLTSVYRMKAHLWLMEDFDRPTRLLDLLWKR
jgi:Tol biopolymer transport system component/DNA-binding winged helix-turn-helix (wHTH) protein/predicted Ser/Thr protein kinase